MRQHGNNGRLLVAGAVCLASALASSAPIRATFDGGDFSNFENKTVLRTDGDAGFSISLAGATKCDTAWMVRSKRIPIEEGAGVFAVGFTMSATADWLNPQSGDTWSSGVDFYDADGRLVDKFGLAPVFRKDVPNRFRHSGRIPAGAKFLAIRFGVDAPNVPPGGSVTVRDARVAFRPAGSELPPDIMPDVVPPCVRLVSESPTEDASVKVKFRITDSSGIAWDTVKVTEKGATEAIPFARDGDVITLEHGAWSRGLHRLNVEAADGAGTRVCANKVFLIGPRPKTPAVTLRDDGVTLIGGEPFFPIGVYGIAPRDFNAYDIDRGLADLKAAGFNFAHSYSCPRSADFLAAAAKHGLRMWSAATGASTGDDWVANVGRDNPWILSWYLADDTSDNTTPEQLLDRDEAVKAMDGTRITCQADPIASNCTRDRYQRYVNYTDVFMPEIYPVHGNSQRLDESCVATTIRDMERSFADIREHGDGKPRAVWPIIQEFRGWGWKRYPTPAMLHAMSFASIIHGAQGFTLYTYGGYCEPDRQKYNFGITATREAWTATTNLTRRLSSLVPVLLERKPAQPPVPEVVKGTKTDPLGQPAVTALLKRHAGRTYLFTVNAAPSAVTARFSLKGVDGKGEVLWEGRTVKAEGGAFSDDFAPYAVHVYVF